MIYNEHLLWNVIIVSEIIAFIHKIIFLVIFSILKFVTFLKTFERICFIYLYLYNFLIKMDPPHNPVAAKVNWRTLIAFWILGLTNNYGYVVMLSAANDILHDAKVIC